MHVELLYYTFLASNPGRRSSAKRTHVIEQVHQLEIQAKINKEGTRVTPAEYEQNMDDVVKLLAKTRLDALPYDAKRLENIIDCEKNYIVGTLFNDMTLFVIETVV